MGAWFLLKEEPRPEAIRKALMQSSDEAPRPPRILIADDTPTAAELLEEYLSDQGYELRIASDGEQTLQQVAEWQPDLILLDVMMPRLSGFEVCKRLRANPLTRDIAVLMITALDQASDFDRAVEAGTNDFVSKPIKKNQVLHRVRALLRSRGHQNPLDRTLSYFEEVQKEEDREANNQERPPNKPH
jgi:PleD family two-component response regulator